MYKIIDNSACTLYLDFKENIAYVYGELRTFNKSSYRDTFANWASTLEALREEGYDKVFTQIKKEYDSVKTFQMRLGFKEYTETDTDLIMVKEL
jgi:hypothetical protein